MRRLISACECNRIFHRCPILNATIEVRVIIQGMLASTVVYNDVAGKLAAFECPKPLLWTICFAAATSNPPIRLAFSPRLSFLRKSGRHAPMPGASPRYGSLMCRPVRVKSNHLVPPSANEITPSIPLMQHVPRHWSLPTTTPGAMPIASWMDLGKDIR